MSSNMNDDNYHDEASSGSIGFLAICVEKLVEYVKYLDLKEMYCLILK